MRVLYVSSGNLFGGIESLLIALARFRSACPEMEPHFALCFEGQLSAQLREAGCPVHILGGVRLSRPWTALRARRRLMSLISGRRFDAVIPHGSWPMTIFGPVVNRSGVPLVFWLHDPPRRPLTILDRTARFAHPAMVICNSRFTAHTLSYLYPGVRHEVVYCALAPPERRLSSSERESVRQELGANPGQRVILQVSRLDPHKGHRLHLEALAALRDMPDWVCWQVAGAQRPHEVAFLEELKEYAGALGIGDRVRFLGWQPDVQRIFQAADVFCQPNSGPEPFGLTFVEAMWVGTPVVTTAMGGPLEIITDECGALVPTGGVQELSEVLRRMVSDGEYRERLAAHAPRRAAQLCDPGDRIRELFGHLCSIRRAATRTDHHSALPQSEGRTTAR